MMFNKYFRDKRILSIDPSSYGFSFAVMEGQFKLVDWGSKSIKLNDPKKFMRKVESLIEYFQPDVIVTEDYEGKGSRRCERIQKLIQGIKRSAKKNRIRVKQFSRDQIRQAFAKTGSLTKHEIAVDLAHRFPELIPHIPKYREAWMSESNSMNVFDALSLGVAYFSNINETHPV